MFSSVNTFLFNEVPLPGGMQQVDFFAFFCSQTFKSPVDTEEGLLSQSHSDNLLLQSAFLFLFKMSKNE